MKPEFRRKDQRGLTPFTAREHFLDYLEERLDTVSRAELDKLLEYDVALRLDFEKFQDAVQYCRKLGTFELSAEAREEILSAPTPLETLAKRVNVQHWPVGLRWGAEALLVLTLVLVGVLAIPWSKVIRVSDREEVVLAEIERGQPIHGTEVAAPSVPSPKEFDDEGAEDKPAAAALTPPVPPEPPATVAAPEAPPAPAPATPTPAPKAVVAAATPKPKPAKTERPPIGSLYRGTIGVTNLDATSAKFVEQITAAGGRKAGEVELGWEKGSTRYFHFTSPEARYDEFLAFANQYGAIRINREPHPRAMPEGIVRVILVLREQGGSP